MNTSIMIASGLTGLLIVWMLTGSNEAPMVEEKQESSDRAKLMSVVVSASNAKLE